MARALQQENFDQDHPPADWRALRSELVALLDQVETQVGSTPTRATRPEEASESGGSRHRDALKSVQRQISRFEEPTMPGRAANDSIADAIHQIRARQMGQSPQRSAAPIGIGAPVGDPQRLDGMVQSVGKLTSRLESLEGDIKTRLKDGADIREVADQVAQLANVVELLAGAVGEAGQVKRLENQIANLTKLVTTERSGALDGLAERLDDVVMTVGRLADQQAQMLGAGRSPAADPTITRGLGAIEANVRQIYDRIDALERQESLSPRELQVVTAEMARFTEALHESGPHPRELVELVDALNLRISEIESGDRLLAALRTDLLDLRTAVISALTPRFDAIEARIDALRDMIGSREDVAEIGRRLGALDERLAAPPDLPGVSQLESQVRQLVARMDQAGEQLSGLTKLRQQEPVPAAIDFSAVADLVAKRTTEAVARLPADDGLRATVSALETRIGKMSEILACGAGDDPHAGLSEVGARLVRLEKLLTEARPVPAEPDGAVIRRAADSMPRSPVDEAPLTAPAFPDPAPAKRLPPLAPEGGLAAPHRGELAAMPPAAPSLAAPQKKMPAPLPAAQQVAASGAPNAAARPSTMPGRNAFIAEHRAAQRQNIPAASTEADSLIGRALARFQSGAVSAAPAGAVASSGAVASVGVAPPHDAMAPLASAEVAAAPGFFARHSRVVLLAAAFVAVGILALNLVAERLAEASVEPATIPAPFDVGAVDGPLTEPASPPAGGAAPRTIEMVDPKSTGSIAPHSGTRFDNTSLAALPSAFAPPPLLEPANAAGAALAVAPSAGTAEPGPIVPRAELPPEGVGPEALRKAAGDGNARAQFEVAAILSEGRVIAKDDARAAQWYRRAAEQGFAPAQYRLGAFYENGQGVDKSLELARQWYQRGAEGGNRMAMHNLAALYAGGQLGEQRFEEAAKWFKAAAERGMTDSQFNLGMLYARGLGVTQSIEESFKWFAVAAGNGDKDAAKARDDMARSLDAATVGRLETEVDGFAPVPIDLAANFAPIGTWKPNFAPGDTIGNQEVVASVQRALAKLGFDIGSPDGIAGAKTAAAIQAFEVATGMSAVGLVNPRLLAVLGSQPV